VERPDKLMGPNLMVTQYVREGNAWKPLTSPPEIVTAYQPWNLPADLPVSAAEVMSHYFPQFAPRLFPTPIPADATVPGYYYQNYYKPGTVEGGTDHRRYGGFTRDFPIQTGLTPTSVTGWEQADMETEIRNAIKAGLSGFTVDLLTIRGYDGSTPDGNWTRLNRLFDAADNVNNTDRTTFRLMLMPDGTAGYATALIRNGTIPDVNASADALAKAVSLFADRPSMYRPNGRLMLAPFGPELWPSDATGVTTQDRFAFWNRLRATLAGTYKQPTDLWMCYVSQWTTVAPTFDSIAYGHGRWGDRDYVSVAAENTNNRGAASYCRITFGKPWMHFGGTPMDTRPNAAGTSGTSYRTWESWGTETLRRSWDAALASAAAFEQIPTWNDYAEHAHISPSRNNTYALLDLQSYYIARYRSGYWPKIRRDGLFLTHRIQRSDTPITNTLQVAFSTPGSSTSMKDDVEVLAFATAPGVVEILLDGSIISTQTVNAAGLTRLITPLPSTTGILSARMTRNGSSVNGTTVISEQPLTTTPTVDDFHYRCYSSLRQFGVTPTTPASSGYGVSYGTSYGA
jgi:hypothetical protein